MERKLNPGKLIETATALSRWIATDFPETGLSRVGVEVERLTEEAVRTAEKIRRPNIFLRTGIVLVLVLIVAVVGYHAYNATLKDIIDFSKGFGFLGVYLIGALIFLVTVEFKLKRRNALRAVQELRAMAHVVDMHQLSKDSELEKFRQDPNKFKDQIKEYLHACTALLSLMSKIGELYVEHFPDEVATAAVNDFESVCTGLNTKIWQKIIATSLSN
jgi:hypothetical protein